MKQFYQSFTLCLALGLTIALINASLHAAGPQTHALLGYEWLKHCGSHYTPTQKESFMMGVLFPDIRLLTHGARESTHLKGINLAAIAADPSAFDAGVKFHAWTDDLREAYTFLKGEDGKTKKSVLEGKLKDIDSVLRGSFLKFLEDQIYYGELDWSQLIRTLDHREFVTPTKVATEKNIQNWYDLLKEQFTESPSQFFANMASKNEDFLDIPPRTLQKWAKLLPVYAENPEYQEHAKDMLAFMLDKIKDCTSQTIYEWKGGGGWGSWFKKITPATLQKLYLQVSSELDRIFSKKEEL